MVRAFLSRAIDGVPSTKILANERPIAEILRKCKIELINPFARSKQVKGDIGQIVEGDLAAIAEANVLVADLSLPNRAYIGAAIEIRLAFQRNVPVVAFVGDSSNANRIFLQYHGSAITTSLEELEQILWCQFTEKGKSFIKQEATAYYEAVASLYAKKECLCAAVPIGCRRVFGRERASFAQQVAQLPLRGPILDLGVGDGLWLETWKRFTTKIVGVDRSAAMLAAARSRRAANDATLREGNVLTDLPLIFKESRLEPFATIVISFVLNGLASREQDHLIKAIKRHARGSTKLLLLENRRSLFSKREYFTRQELQRRRIPGSSRVYILWKQHYLKSDLQRLARLYGRVEYMFETGNFFIGCLVSRV